MTEKNDYTVWLERASATTLIVCGLMLIGNNIGFRLDVQTYIWAVILCLAGAFQMAVSIKRGLILRGCATWGAILVTTFFAFNALNIAIYTVSVFVCVINIISFITLSEKISFDTSIRE